MGRGVSAGGGQSSLGYLFGSQESSKPAANGNQFVKPQATNPVDVTNLIPAGIQSSAANKHFGAHGQNTCNYISDRPSTKIHAAPGGGSSLGYLFGDGGN